MLAETISKGPDTAKRAVIKQFDPDLSWAHLYYAALMSLGRCQTGS